MRRISRACPFSRRWVQVCNSCGVGQESVAQLLSGLKFVHGPAILMSSFMRKGKIADWEEKSLTYQQTIQQAFRGVSDSLVEYRKDREFREYQQQLALSAQDAAQLSDTRYRCGAASYLEVLKNETNCCWDSLKLS